MIKGFENGGYICICDKILPKGVVCCRKKVKKQLNNCLICGNATHNKMFCNRACLKKAQWTKKQQVCTGCGTKFIRYKSESDTSNIYCTQACFQKHKVTSDDFTV